MNLNSRSLQHSLRAIFVLMLTFLFALPSVAMKEPHWSKKAKAKVVTIVTFDQHHNILKQGNGFLLGNNGEAIALYSLFYKAYSAKVYTTKGREFAVSTIVGASSLYDVVKLKLADHKDNDIPDGFELSSKALPVQDHINLVPFAKHKRDIVVGGNVSAINPLGEKDNYYTFSIHFPENAAGCPIVDDDGNVVAISQSDASVDSLVTAYGIGIHYINDLHVSILDATNVDYTDIDITKELPVKEDAALVYLMTSAGTLSPARYARLLSQFIKKFPNSIDGYLKRSDYFLTLGIDSLHCDLATQDYNHALSLNNRVDEVYFQRATQISQYLTTLAQENARREYILDQLQKQGNDSVSMIRLEPIVGWNSKDLIDHLNKAISNTSADKKESYQLSAARIEVQNGLYPEASSRLRSLIATNDSLYMAHRLLGVVLAETNQKEEGLRELKKAQDMGDKVASQLIGIYTKQDDAENKMDDKQE
ncbi:MAG: hypothetical protein WCR36_00605 [Bacteroidaceae bacterium]